jgi:hypothetical protein
MWGKGDRRITHETMSKWKLGTFAVTLQAFHYIILHIASMSQTNFFSACMQYLYWENVQPQEGPTFNPLCPWNHSWVTGPNQVDQIKCWEKRFIWLWQWSWLWQHKGLQVKKRFFQNKLKLLRKPDTNNKTSPSMELLMDRMMELINKEMLPIPDICAELTFPGWRMNSVAMGCSEV